jgi:hypothetical protein
MLKCSLNWCNRQLDLAIYTWLTIYEKWGLSRYSWLMWTSVCLEIEWELIIMGHVMKFRRNRASHAAVSKPCFTNTQGTDDHFVYFFPFSNYGLRRQFYGFLVTKSPKMEEILPIFFKIILSYERTYLHDNCFPDLNEP